MTNEDNLPANVSLHHIQTSGTKKVWTIQPASALACSQQAAQKNMTCPRCPQIPSFFCFNYLVALPFCAWNTGIQNQNRVSNVRFRWVSPVAPTKKLPLPHRSPNTCRKEMPKCGKDREQTVPPQPAQRLKHHKAY